MSEVPLNAVIALSASNELPLTLEGIPVAAKLPVFAVTRPSAFLPHWHRTDSAVAEIPQLRVAHRVAQTGDV